MAISGAPLITWLAALCLLLPWLNPVAGGPSAVIQPWLVSAACTFWLWVLAVPQVTRRQLAAAILIAAALAGVGHAAPPVLLAVGGLIVIAISAAVGATATRQGAGSVLATTWLIAALTSSVFAMAQYFGLVADLAPWVNETSPGEAFANLRQRNQFATLTSIGLVALLWKAQKTNRCAWLAAAGALLATANAASGSRTGAVQIVLLVIMTFWWMRPLERGRTLICIVAIASYATAALVLPIALHALTGINAPNAFSRMALGDGCGSRAVLWSNVVHLITQRPWPGWGWGELDYAHFATLYPGARFCDILDNAHNLPLHLAVELGIPAAVLAVGGFVVWVVRQRPWRETDATRVMAWSVIAMILLHSLLEYPLWYGPFQMAFGLSVGLLVARNTPSATKMVSPAGKRAIAALLACALLYAAWDYHRISQLYTPPEERSTWYRQHLPRIGDSWLFRDQLAFAELSSTPLTRANAPAVHALALELLHYSPEPRVIEVAIESAMQVGREEEALWLLARYRAAFPDDYDNWSKAQGLRKPPASGVKE